MDPGGQAAVSGPIVVDASAAVHVVMRDTQAVPLIHSLEAAPLVLAPRLFAAETTNALWKYLRYGYLAPEEAQTRLAEVLSLADQFEPDENLVHEALLEAGHREHPVYDLLYIVLARRYGAALLTQDNRLATVAEAVGIHVAK